MSVYSIIPASFVMDRRMNGSHKDVMMLLGVYSTRKGWIRISQTALADKIGCARSTVNRAIRDLVDWGYLEKRAKTDTHTPLCFYRIVMVRDEPDAMSDDLEIEGDDDVSDEGGCSVGDTGGLCGLEATTVVALDATQVRSKNRSTESVPSTESRPALAREQASSTGSKGRAPAARAQEARREKKPVPRVPVPRTASASDGIAFDRLRRRAEGFGVDVDEIMHEVRRTKPRSPAAFFEALAINRLRHTGLVEQVLRAALRGEAEATKLLFEVLLTGAR